MARPAVFAALGFEAAIARSRADRSVVIVDATAVWCGPCREMDRTTWVDPAVVARLTAPSRSFAIQIDVDAQRALAGKLEITAMPTLVAFVGGVEHDRLVGGRDADELIEWLDIVERGDRIADVERAARQALLDRGLRASAALAAAQYDDALRDYLWLWSRGDRAALVDDVRRLAAAHAPARAAFVELRDAATPVGAGDNPPPLDAVGQWITLNQIVADDDATLGWYDANRADLPPSRTVAQLVEVAIVPLLMSRARWTDAGRALADPTATFSRLAKTRTGADLRDDAANLVRAIYAAGRDERASDVEFEACSADPSPDMAAALASAKALGRGDRAAKP